MKAGRKKWLIEVEKFTTTTNSLNEKIKAWAPYCSAYASIHFGSGGEQREAAQNQALQTATFEIYSDATSRAISVKDRIIYEGHPWEIKSIAPIGFNEDVKLNATMVIAP